MVKYFLEMNLESLLTLYFSFINKFWDQADYPSSVVVSEKGPRMDCYTDYSTDGHLSNSLE